MKDPLQAIIEETRKAYRIAEIKLEGKFLVNRNNISGCLHPFSDGQERIPLSENQVVKIKEVLK